MAEREPGFYWVQVGGEQPEIAKLTDTAWDFVCDILGLPVDDPNIRVLAGPLVAPKETQADG